MIRPFGAKVVIRPMTSRDQAELEERLNGGMAMPEVRTDPRRARLRFGTLVAVGPGRCEGACVEQPDRLYLPIGGTVAYEFFGGYEHRINGDEVHIVESKTIMAHIGGMSGITALGWWALVRDLSKEFEEHKNGAGALPCADFGDPTDLKGDIRSVKLKLQGGRIVSMGRGTYIHAKKGSPEVMRSWRGFEPGERLAFNAQTATMLHIGKTRYYFASCAADIAGAAAYVW